MDRNFEKYLRCGGYEIFLERDCPQRNWYIKVKGPDGCYAYDGWWNNSEFTTWQQALEEAKRGACIGRYKVPSNQGDSHASSNDSQRRNSIPRT